MPPTCTQQSQVSMQLNVSKHTEHTPNLILSTHPESICMANLKIMPNTDTTSAMQTEPKQQCIARNYSEMNKKRWELSLQWPLQPTADNVLLMIQF